MACNALADFYTSNEYFCKKNNFSSMIYMSDHGENFFDDQRNLSQHADMVPLLVWASDKLKNHSPDKMNALSNNLRKSNSAENLLYTFTDLVEIQHELSDSTKSLSNTAYKEKTRYIFGSGFIIYNSDSLK